MLSEITYLCLNCPVIYIYIYILNKKSDIKKFLLLFIIQSMILLFPYICKYILIMVLYPNGIHKLTIAQF